MRWVCSPGTALGGPGIDRSEAVTPAPMSGAGSRGVLCEEMVLVRSVARWPQYPCATSAGQSARDRTGRTARAPEELPPSQGLCGDSKLCPHLLAVVGSLAPMVEGQSLDEQHAAARFRLRGGGTRAREIGGVVVNLDQQPLPVRVDAQTDGQSRSSAVLDRIGHEFGGDHRNGVPGAVVQVDVPVREQGLDPSSCPGNSNGNTGYGGR